MQGPLQEAEGTGSSAQQSAAGFLPLVYAELRRLAASRLAQEKPGQTLQPTALVHEAWLRLVRDGRRQWADSRHFFFAAATAMRRILIENARRKARVKHGGLLEQVELSETALASPAKSSELLALDESLERLGRQEPQAARLVELRYFAGFKQQEAAQLLGISRRTGERLWAYARAWLLADLRRNPGETKL